jgi:protein ImuA
MSTPCPAALAAAIPHVWCANQMASRRAASIPTGYPSFDSELPDAGWPTGALIELLPQQTGIGEMQLLQPALRRLAQHRRIALIEPPYVPQIAAWTNDGFPVKQMMWVKAKRSVDALWAAEQVLRNGTCGALLFWQPHVRNDALRRLHLAAQASDIVFWLIRPFAAAVDASPAPLRLALRPVPGGIHLEIVKRRGPRRAAPLFLPFDPLSAAHSSFNELDHALVDRPPSAPVAARNVSSSLV